MPPLLLASASPRRKSFLLELGFDFRVVHATVDESILADEEPLDYVRRVALLKARAAAGSVPGAVVLAADTIVQKDGEVLGKPQDEADFRRIMGKLSGATHEVVTCVVARVIGGETFDTSVSTQVTFRALGEAELAWYWASGEAKDKAGAYGIQHRGGAFVTRIDGSHSNVIGLPLVETLALLEKAGVKPPWIDPRVRS